MQLFTADPVQATHPAALHPIDAGYEPGKRIPPHEALAAVQGTHCPPAVLTAYPHWQAAHVATEAVAKLRL